MPTIKQYPMHREPGRDLLGPMTEAEAHDLQAHLMCPELCPMRYPYKGLHNTYFVFSDCGDIYTEHRMAPRPKASSQRSASRP